MNGEGGIGHAEEDLGYLRGEFVTGFEFGSPFPGGYYPDISMGFVGRWPQTFFELPPLGTGSGTAETGDSADEVAGDSALPDPEEFPSVYESAGYLPARVPGGIYETNRAPTDWDRVYDEYVILNPREEEDVPFHEGVIDWGVDVLAGVAGGILDPAGIGAAIQTAYAPSWLTTPGVTGIPSLGQQTTLATPTPITAGATMEHGCPPYGPKYGKICLATGVVTPLRRRRRRRLLTSSDIKDLSALKSIVGGAALQAAVTQAVRR